MANVIGLDLSLSGTGMVTATTQECIKTEPEMGEKPVRWVHIRDRIVAAALRECPDLIVIEDLPTNAKFGGADLGPVHGVVRTALHEMGHRPLLIPPGSLKKFVLGKGVGSKADIRMGIFKRYGLDITNDNTADAFGLMALGLYLLGAPIVKLPAAHTSMLPALAPKLVRP